MVGIIDSIAYVLQPLTRGHYDIYPCNSCDRKIKVGYMIGLKFQQVMVKSSLVLFGSFLVFSNFYK